MKNLDGSGMVLQEKYRYHMPNFCLLIFPLKLAKTKKLTFSKIWKVTKKGYGSSKSGFKQITVVFNWFLRIVSVV